MKLGEAEDYWQLINTYLNREIDVAEFEKSFLERFKNEQRQFSDEVFTTLDRLFSDLDMFCAEDELRDEDELDEGQLRKACERALMSLDEVKRHN